MNNRFYFFLACERAEFSKSCNLIGSGSGRKFFDLACSQSDSARLARCVTKLSSLTVRKNKEVIYRLWVGPYREKL